MSTTLRLRKDSRQSRWDFLSHYASGLFLTLMLMLWSAAGVAQTKTVTFKVSEFAGLLKDQGPAVESAAPDGKGRQYGGENSEGWTFGLTDAKVNDDKSIEIYRGSYFRIHEQSDKHIRFSSVNLGTFTESEGVYIYPNTYTGKVTKTYTNPSTMGDGYGTCTAVWYPSYQRTENDLRLVAIGLDGTSTGCVKLAADNVITISYTEDDAYPMKQDCYMKIEFETLRVPLNNNQITEPTVVIYSDEACTKRISSKFHLNYYIYKEPIKQTSVDSKTGSTLDFTTGNIVSGGTPGDFIVMVRAYPASEDAAKICNSVVGRYTVKVDGEESFIKIRDAQYGQKDTYKNTINEGTIVNNPPYAIIDKNGEDVTSHYNLIPKVDITSGGNGKADFTTNETTFQCAITPTHTDRVYKGILTFSPKEGESSQYSAVKTNFELTVKGVNKPIAAKILLKGTEVGVDKADENKQALYFLVDWNFFCDGVARVWDEYGNEITSGYDLGKIGNQEITIKSTGGTGLSISYMDADEAAEINRKSKNDPGYIESFAGDPKFYAGTKEGTAVIHYHIAGQTKDGVTYPDIDLDVNVYIGPQYCSPVFTPERIVVAKGQTYSNSNLNLIVYRYIGDINKTILASSNYRYTVSVTGGKNGIQLLNSNGRSVTTLTDQSNSSKWSVRGVTPGEYSLTFVFTRVDKRSWGSWESNYYFATTTVTLPVKVTDAIKPTASFDKGSVSCAVGSDPQEPILSIVNAEGTDVKGQYTVTYSALKASEPVDGVVNPTTGILNSSTAGNWTIVASFTSKDPDNYLPIDPISYVYNVGNYGWGYTTEIVPGKDYYNMHLVSTGPMPGGTVIDDVPGLKITIGTKADMQWNVKQNGSIYAVDGQVELNPNNLMTVEVVRDPLNSNTVTAENIPFEPIGGTFYKLEPYTDGFLTVKALWKAGHEYWLIEDYNGEVEREVFKPTATGFADHKFTGSIRSTSKVYLYDTYSYTTETDRGLQLSAISFDPQYLAKETDTEPVDLAMAFMYTGSDGNKVMHKEGLPWLTHAAYDCVKHGAEEAYSSYITPMDDETGGMGIYDIFKNSEDVTSHTATLDGTATGTVADKRIRIYAKIHGNANSDNMVLRYYDLMIQGLPAYVIADAYTPEVQEKVTEVPGVVMTWGGWDLKDKTDYPNQAGTEKQDAWGESYNDVVGMNNASADGFRAASVMLGTSDPQDEVADVYDIAKNGVAQTYNLPRRGDYVTLAVEKPGTMYVYVLQEGCLPWDGKMHLNPVSHNNLIKWRPLYIVDEQGNNVKTKPYDGMGDKRGNENNGMYTEALYACPDPTEVDGQKSEDGGSFTFEWDSELSEAQKALITKNWPKDDATEKMQTVFNEPDGEKESGGHLLISKGFVRYTFDVDPGKTYFIFQKNALMGFAGFAFKENKDATVTEKTLAKNVAYTAPSEKTYATVKHTRTFTANKWNATVLPFSMTYEQIQKNFGEGTEIIYMQEIKNDSIVFIRHYNQLVVAGQPLMIKPTYEGTSITPTNDKVTEMTFADVTLDPATSPLVSILVPEVKVTYDEDWNVTSRTVTNKTAYEYVGTYTPATSGQSGAIPVNSWFVSSGKLYTNNAPTATNAYFSWLQPYTTTNAKRMLYVEEGMEDDLATDIFEVETTDKKVIDGDIYNLNGQKVRAKATSTDGLPAGIYIMNGQKVIVK